MTPLMFSWRGHAMNWGYSYSNEVCGYPHLSSKHRRLWYFYKGKAYYNADLDRAWISETRPPAFRGPLLKRIPKEWHRDVLAAPFDPVKYATMYARLLLLTPEHAFGWIHVPKSYERTRTQDFSGKTAEALQELSDHEVKRYLKQMLDLEVEYTNAVWPGLTVVFRDAAAVLGWMVEHWYRGDSAILTEVLSGSIRRSGTALENVALYELAELIRGSGELSALFRSATTAAEFFGRLEESAAGRAFLSDYREFVRVNGHRGQSDRDIYFLRRAEDPAVDWLPLQALVNASTSLHPEVREARVNERRAAAVAEVVTELSSQPLGSLKAKAFTLLCD